MTLHNMMEEIVKNCLKDLIHNQPKLAVLNDKGFEDVMAITLNKLPAKYVSTLRGEVFAKTQLRLQVETDVYRELTLAIERVVKTE